MFFQNVFSDEYQGYLVLGDRQHSLTFKCLPNIGRGSEYVRTNGIAPFDLSGNDANGNATDTLLINYAFDPELKFYAQLAIDVTSTAASSSAVTYVEVVEALQDDETFASLFEAGVHLSGTSVVIKPRRARTDFRFYISNGQAESVLKFNKFAGISEMPSYFDKHTIANRFNFPKSDKAIVALSHRITNSTAANPTVITSANHGLTSGNTIIIANSNSTPTTDGTRIVTVINENTFSVPVNVTVAGDRGDWYTPVEQEVIENAVDYKGASLGHVAANIQLDWELLAGRSGLFEFTRTSTAAAASISRSIIYPAGAVVGDLAIKHIKELDGGGVTLREYRVPYTLAAADIISPP